MADGRAAFARRVLVPHVLGDVTNRSSEVTLFGHSYGQPFGIAPMGGVTLCKAGGDTMMAGAAARAGIPMILSGASFTPLEEVAAALPGLWFQPLLPSKAEDAVPLLERATAAGIGALVLTADLAVPGWREADVRNGFGHPLRISRRLTLQALARPRWLFTTGRHFSRGTPSLPNLAPVSAGRPPREAASFNTIEGLRRHWTRPMLVKGVLHPDDARRCIAAGADGVIVSNHGGRQLDGAITALDALAAVKDAVGPAPVLLDGGVRRGTDVLKALALGASMVLVGRPMLYAAASGGTADIARAISLLAAEIDRAMALCGCGTLVGAAQTVVVGTAASAGRSGR